MASYHLLVNVLRWVAEHPQVVTGAVAEAQAELIRRGAAYDPSDQVALEMTSGASGRAITIEGWEVIVETDERTGMECLSYTRTPHDFEVPLIDDITATRTVVRPAAYIIPQEYGAVAVPLLRLHGVRVARAVEPFGVEAEVYHVEALSFRERPYQGHLLAVPTIGPPERRRLDLPAGTYLVPMDQPACEIAALILEPGSADGLLAWNRMNYLTSDPKVREDWVLANLGRRMMEDPEIAEAFKRRAEDDPEFMDSERAKAQFFWDHSPYPTPGIGDYPIARALTRPPAATETVLTSDP
jgi:hypothetical protein